jgi:hypothetical protein
MPAEPLAQYLTGPAANQLQGDGTLRVANVQTATRRRQIDENRAREIATAFIATHLRGLRQSLERDRGASIDVQNVVVCPRAFYAESPFEELPDEVPRVYHQLYGPWWLTSLCAPGGEPVVSLGISAYATDLSISDGKLRYPDVAGGEFRWVGIRPGEANLLPVPPESAVRRGGSVASRRIASIPRLVLRASGYPQLAQWQLTLDSETDVRVLQAASSARTKEVFVGAEATSPPSTRIAAPQQPDAIEIEWRPWPVVGQTPDTPLPPARTTRMVRRVGFPVTFQEVERGGGQ